MDEFADRDERSGGAADTVVNCGHLRHLRHLDDTRRVCRRAATDEQRHDHVNVVLALPASVARLQEGSEDCESHPAGGELIAEPRARRRAQELETEDEKYRRSKVGDIDDRLLSVVDHFFCLATGFFLNISSMRSV